MTFVNLHRDLRRSERDESAAVVSPLLALRHEALRDASSFVGANDGGSSNGVLIEMARVLAQRPALAAKVQLVFFDGEEAYVDFTETDGLYGSRYFAKQLQAEGKGEAIPRRHPLRYGRRQVAHDYAFARFARGDRAKGIFAAAEALKLRKHFTYSAGAISSTITRR